MNNYNKSSADFHTTINRIIEHHSKEAIDAECSNGYMDIGHIPKAFGEKAAVQPDNLLDYVCSKCGFEFADISLYEHHLDNVHSYINNVEDLRVSRLSENLAECLICGAQFRYYSVRDLQSHHFLHLQHKSYKCKCHGYFFTDKMTALCHLSYQRKREIAPVVDTVDWSFKIDNQTVEYDPQYPETGMGYICSECGDNFVGEDLWKAHCNEMHAFKSIEGLQMTRIDNTSVRCNRCSAIISGDNYKLRRHKLTHSPFKAFYCRLCKYSRKRKDDVIQHIRKIHGSHNQKLN